VNLLVVFQNEIRVDAGEKHDGNAWEEPGQEQAFEGHIADHAVKDHADAGRNDDAQVRRGGHDADRIGLRVLVLYQGRDHETAEGHHGGHR